MKLKEFLPQKTNEKQYIQGKVDTKVYMKMNALRKKQKLTWDELLNALAEYYISAE